MLRNFIYDPLPALGEKTLPPVTSYTDRQISKDVFVNEQGKFYTRHFIFEQKAVVVGVQPFGQIIKRHIGKPNKEPYIAIMCIDYRMDPAGYLIYERMNNFCLYAHIGFLRFKESKNVITFEREKLEYTF